MQRILSISGLRAVAGDGLDPDFLCQFAAAVGTIAKGGSIVVSRDGRSSGEMVKHAVLSGLMATGCRVIDAGIATTPTCGVLVTHHKAAGGIQITASHNPVPWNGLKPFNAQGSVYNREEGQELLSLLESRQFSYVTYDQIGSVELLQDPAGPHRDRVFSLVDVEAIRQKQFKVVLDCNHGSGAVSTPELLEKLGCEVIVMGGTPDGQFAHTPEPLAENLTTLSERVRKEGADVGFAQDPDADRLAIVDEQGNYIGEELTLALAVDYVLERKQGPVVVNGSTSRVTADLAAKYGCEFHRSHVGEANVVAKMKACNALIGGEGNGGVIEPQVGFVRDSFVSMAYVLAGLTSKEGSLSDWVETIPKYAIVKSKLTCPQEAVGKACEALREHYQDATATEGDGLRLDWDDRWVQVRASNTEPIIRVIAEAPKNDQANALCEQAREIISRKLS
ncbi:phosphoglucosamine mutase [Rubinisphaera sp.]|uniref:phosphoglucosamine mutase n=1 Tax=Rubinisphaera sp. TaxID=2024857 RepID=UPI000C0C71DD|nr:phosphoglucosamine mutase [Rubinisphaera sp.]MBV11283.1 phosphoglucosamine mutase [Rubinisphaera sp.]|tara:strand:- start:302 stop:1648 length:1347 start_codon:yes stop_codon:yes gene_type:complete